MGTGLTAARACRPSLPAAWTSRRPLAGAVARHLSSSCRAPPQGVAATSGLPLVLARGPARHRELIAAAHHLQVRPPLTARAQEERRLAGMGAGQSMNETGGMHVRQTERWIGQAFTARLERLPGAPSRSLLLFSLPTHRHLHLWRHTAVGGPAPARATPSRAAQTSRRHASGPGARGSACQAPHALRRPPAGGGQGAGTPRRRRRQLWRQVRSCCWLRASLCSNRAACMLKQTRAAAPHCPALCWCTERSPQRQHASHRCARPSGSPHLQG